MEAILPTDCGNAPRMITVGDFVINWAKHDTDALAELLTEDASWTILGHGTHTGAAAATDTAPPIQPERVVVRTIVTHGRLASCDGYLEAGTTRLDFSHVFRFAGATKTAKITELRTYGLPPRRTVGRRSR